MRCDVCGRQFDAKEQEKLCREKCRFWGICGLDPCPTCFFESVLEPEWYSRTKNA